MKKITVWRKQNRETKEFEHNHIEDDWVKEDYPNPKTDIQKNNWKGSIWQKIFAYLINNEVVYEKGKL